MDAIGESIGTLLTFTVIEGVSVVGALHALFSGCVATGTVRSATRR